MFVEEAKSGELLAKKLRIRGNPEAFPNRYGAIIDRQVYVETLYSRKLDQIEPMNYFNYNFQICINCFRIVHLLFALCLLQHLCLIIFEKIDVKRENC